MDEDYKEYISDSIRSLVEQEPFRDPTAQDFLRLWCDANDSIEPRIVSREEWEDKVGLGKILDKSLGEKSTLYLPEDLHLWEMIGVMETVDHDTYPENSEHRNEVSENIRELAKIFIDTSSYIAQRIDSVGEGSEFALALAEEFYRYGHKILKEDINLERPITVAEMSSHPLSEKETKVVDRFLVGDSVYKSRVSRAGKLIQNNPDSANEVLESERKRTLSQLFRVAEKSILLSDRVWVDDEKRNHKGWEDTTSIHEVFYDRVKKTLRNTIETPRREFENAFFRRGMELLSKNISFDSLPEEVKRIVLHWDSGEKTLYDALGINRLRDELAQIREEGSTEEISAKEWGIANMIQIAVSEFPRSDIMHNPSEILEKEALNCLGASILGGSLMEAAGLKYLVASVPSHSILLLILSDGSVEWRDMLNPHFNDIISDNAFIKKNEGLERPNTKDIIDFSENPSPHGLKFLMADSYKEKLPWVEEGNPLYIYVFGPKYGQEIQLLNNFGYSLENMGYLSTEEQERKKYFEMAIQVYHRAIELEPQFSYPYFHLGRTLGYMGKYPEALEAFRQTYRIDPDISNLREVGHYLYKSGEREKSIETYRHIIELKPEYASAYSDLGLILEHSGKHEEAIELYRKAMELEPDKFTDYYGLGFSLVNVGDYSEAAKAFQKSLEIFPESYLAYFSLGVCHAKIGEYPAAIEYYEEYLKRANSDIDGVLMERANDILNELRNT